MSTNEIIQYSLVGVILLSSLVWIVVKTFKHNKSKGGCCGCNLQQTCNKAALKNNRTNENCKDLE